MLLNSSNIYHHVTFSNPSSSVLYGVACLRFRLMWAESELGVRKIQQEIVREVEMEMEGLLLCH